MKISSPLLLNIAINAEAKPRSVVKSFSSLLANGIKNSSIAKERAFGFAETGVFGAYRHSANSTYKDKITINPVQSQKTQSPLLNVQSVTQFPKFSGLGAISNAVSYPMRFDPLSQPIENYLASEKLENKTTISSKSLSDRDRVTESQKTTQKKPIPDTPAAVKTNRRKLTLSNAVLEDEIDISIRTGVYVEENYHNLDRELSDLAHQYGVTVRRLMINGKEI
jgi:hypothetical protein